MIDVTERLLPELMDQPELALDETERALDDLARVNRRLFGLRAAIKTLEPRLVASRRRQTLLDLGTGSGQVPAAIARTVARRGVELRVVGVDRKLSHLLHGRRRGVDQLRVVADADRLPFAAGSFDWTLSNLFFHHFGRQQNLQILAEMRRIARRGAAVVDLRRSTLARVTVRFFLALVRVGHVAAYDGRLSVRQAWPLEEVARLVEDLPAAELRRCFPFRFSLFLPGGSSAAG